MSRKYAFLIDLSGTLHIDDSVIPGTLRALEKLRAIENSHILFVTNTTKQSSRNLHERLNRLNLRINRSEIFSSLSAAKHFVDRYDLDPMLIVEDDVLEDFLPLTQQVSSSDTKEKAVVVGLAPSKFNYRIMNKAFLALMDGAKLIAIHKGRCFKTGAGLNLGPGPFVRALEYATDKEAVVIGKPESSFFQSAMEKCDVSTDRGDEIFMIGDDVRDDIQGAQRLGIKGLLVKTGKYRDGDETNISPKPWRLVKNFAHAVEILCEYVKGNC